MSESQRNITILLLCMLIHESSSFLTRPWLRRANSTHQYQFNDDKRTWMEAREVCRQQGGDLLSVNDNHEFVSAHLSILSR